MYISYLKFMGDMIIKVDNHKAMYNYWKKYIQDKI